MAAPVPACAFAPELDRSYLAFCPEHGGWYVGEWRTIDGPGRWVLAWDVSVKHLGRVLARAQTFVRGVPELPVPRPSAALEVGNEARLRPDNAHGRRLMAGVARTSASSRRRGARAEVSAKPVCGPLGEVRPDGSSVSEPATAVSSGAF